MPNFFLWKYSIIFLICCSHPWLIKIIFQSSNCMDPRLLAIILFHLFLKRDISSFWLSTDIYLFFFVVHQICIFKQGWDKICTNVKEHFDTVLTVHPGMVICDSLARVQLLLTCLPCLFLSPSWTWGLTRQILKISCRG
jgi:hypothetical protein